jgi:hypothetical protein
VPIRTLQGLPARRDGPTISLPTSISNTPVKILGGSSDAPLSPEPPKIKIVV